MVTGGSFILIVRDFGAYHTCVCARAFDLTLRSRLTVKTVSQVYIGRKYPITIGKPKLR